MADTSVCGYRGDPVCFPPNCGGACPSNMPDLRPPHPPCSILGTMEIRAWARASARIASDEGFTHTAAAIQEWIDWFDELYAAGVHTVRIERGEQITNDR